MKQKNKSRFWIPAAICVTAFLVAVSMMAPKNLTDVFAAETDGSATVEPLQTEEGNDPADDPDDDPADDPADDEFVIPDDIKEYPVASFTATGEYAYLKTNEIREDAADIGVYYSSDDDENVWPYNSVNGVSFTKNIAFYSKENKEAITQLAADGVASVDVKGLTALENLEIKGSLSALDLSKNVNLKNLKLEATNLTKLDLSKNVKLETVDGSISSFSSR